MGHSSKRNRRSSRAGWILVILALVAVLVGLIAWVVLQDQGCSDGSCSTEPNEYTTTFPSSTEAMATEETTGATETEESTTEVTETEPTTQPPTEPEPVLMRVVTPVDVYDAPQEDAEVTQSLSIGQTVAVTDNEGDWCCLALEDQTGYVTTSALRPVGEYLIVIDPGHQGKGNSEKEPVGPGASEMKAKVASGTQGVSTKIPEYALTLQVSLKLRDLLEEQGYQVVMIRTDHAVNISNAERAQMANEIYADVFIRVHANGDSNSATNGIMTLCQTETNPYNADLYSYSKCLSDLVLDEMVSATGANRQFVWETDTMSGINWCRVPVTIVEMGYMSNPEEDRLMATEEYQQKLVQGMAKGIEQYLNELGEAVP